MTRIKRILHKIKVNMINFSVVLQSREKKIHDGEDWER